jgi:NAD(P)-dependent dehydrogenase (short-subunit alcohol dehydrogenase family)
MPETVLVAGANRGIGLAVVKIYLAKGDKVFAACRKPREAEALKDLKKANPKNLEIIRLDVNSDSSVKAAAKAVSSKTKSIDTLLNVAGILPRPNDAKLKDLDLRQFGEAFETNAVGPVRVSRAFLPLLRRAKNPRVVNVSSDAGSISQKNWGGNYAYGASKAALNMITRTFAFEFKPEKIVSVAIHPGWVQTDMGGPDAHLTPEQSAAPLVKTVKKLRFKDTAKFMFIDGKEMKW